MGVLSSKAFEVVKQEKLKKTLNVPARGTEDPAPEVQEEKTKRTFVLLFPEPAEGRPRSFKKEIKIEDKTYQIECINDRIETTEEAVAQRLQKSQYILIDIKEPDNG